MFKNLLLQCEQALAPIVLFLQTSIPIGTMFILDDSAAQDLRPMSMFSTSAGGSVPFMLHVRDRSRVNYHLLNLNLLIKHNHDLSPTYRMCADIAESKNLNNAGFR